MNANVFVHSFWFAGLWQGFFLIPCKNHCSNFKPWSPEEGAVHSPPNTAAKTDQWLNRHCCTPWTRDSSPLPRLHIPPAGKGNFRTGTQWNIQLKYFRLNGTRGLGYLLPINANPTCFVNVYPTSLSSSREWHRRSCESYSDEENIWNPDCSLNSTSTNADGSLFPTGTANERFLHSPDSLQGGFFARGHAKGFPHTPTPDGDSNGKARAFACFDRNQKQLMRKKYVPSEKGMFPWTRAVIANMKAAHYNQPLHQASISQNHSDPCILLLCKLVFINTACWPVTSYYVCAFKYIA